MTAINYADLLIWYVAFMLSFTAHEAAHAFAAFKGGDETAYQGGQASLNPIPHIQRSPVGTVVVPVLSFLLWGWMIGWASAPYDPQWAARYPRRAAWMAAAGPAANLILFVATFFLLKFGLSSELFQAPTREQLFADNRLQLTNIVVSSGGSFIGVAKLLSVLFALNLILLIFNLFPFPPLDGSAVITLLMSEQHAHKFTQFINQPMYSFVGIIIAWRVFSLVFWDIFGFLLRALHANLSPV